MRSGSTRLLLAFVACIVTMGLLASCSDAGDEVTGDTTPDGQPIVGAPTLEDVNLQEEDGPGTPGGKLTYGTYAESDGWNPTSGRWSPSALVVAKSMFETLAAYDAELGWKANFAEAFVPSDDYMEWRIVLRPGLTFHNGDPVDGEAVNRMLNAHMNSTLTYQPFDPVEKIEQTGELEVTATMKEPWVNWPYAMTTQIGVVGEPDWIESGDSREPIGQGAFEFVSWNPNDRLIVKKFDGYFREGYPLLDEVEFRPITDELARSNALETGQIDIMLTTTGTEVAKFKDLAESTGNFQVVNDPGGETEEFVIMMNTKDPSGLMSDPKARRALALATDRETYIETVSQGEFVPAYGPYAPSSPWYTETDYPRFDLEAAKALVEEVKAEHGGQFAVTINAPPTPAVSQGMQLIQSQWEAAGVTVNISTMDTTQLIASVILGNYQATAWTQFDSPHPVGDSIWFHPDAATEIPDVALNMARNDNPTIGQALDEARAEPDLERQKELYGILQTELAKDIPYIWLYHVQITVVANSNLVNIVNWELPDGSKGMPLHGGAHPLWQIWRRA